MTRNSNYLHGTALLICFLRLLESSLAVTFEEMYADCHDDYTCLMYPEPCHKSQDCDLIVIIIKLGSKYNFRLLGTGPYYVAVGMSKDRAMGHDAVVFCTDELVGTAINPGGRNMTRVLDWDPDIQNVEMKIENGKVICQFDAPKTFVVDTLEMNLEEPLYLLLATGAKHFPPLPLVPFAPHSIKLSSLKALRYGVSMSASSNRLLGRSGETDDSQSNASDLMYTRIVLWMWTLLCPLINCVLIGIQPNMHYAS